VCVCVCVCVCVTHRSIKYVCVCLCVCVCVCVCNICLYMYYICMYIIYKCIQNYIYIYICISYCFRYQSIYDRCCYSFFSVRCSRSFILSFVFKNNVSGNVDKISVLKSLSSCASACLSFPFYSFLSTGWRSVSLNRLYYFFFPTFFPQVGEAFAKSSVHDKAGAKKFIIKYVKKKKNRTSFVCNVVMQQSK
jgi:hypothetical protein